MQKLKNKLILAPAKRAPARLETHTNNSKNNSENEIKNIKTFSILKILTATFKAHLGRRPKTYQSQAEISYLS